MRWIVGVDEAGRGPFAGPVYVGVYAIPKSGFDTQKIAQARDSKLLTHKTREKLYEELTRNQNARYAVASSSAKVIDKAGITFAIRQSVRRALGRLSINPSSCEVFLDGGITAPKVYVHQKTIVKGDQKIKVISAASILAKVSRDKKMLLLAKRYPNYRFDVNKGYGTKVHREMLGKYGLCPEHRKTFCKKYAK